MNTTYKVGDRVRKIKPYRWNDTLHSAYDKLNLTTGTVIATAGDGCFVKWESSRTSDPDLFSPEGGSNIDGSCLESANELTEEEIQALHVSIGLSAGKQTLSQALHAAADTMNDAADHDELHAAGALYGADRDLVAVTPYLQRWILGLIERHNIEEKVL